MTTDSDASIMSWMHLVGQTVFIIIGKLMV